MDFYRELSRLGKLDMLYTPTWSFPNMSTEGKVINSLKDIIINNKSVYLYGDPDPDGAMCVEIFKETFKYLGFDRYEVHSYRSRSHKVDPVAINRAIAGRFDYMIICDAGSSDPRTMERLKLMGVNVILLDHHESIYGYQQFEGISMINTMFENRLRDDKEQIVISAGALVYIICHKLIDSLGHRPLDKLSALALVSMYGDSIDMSGDLARGIYYRAMNLGVNNLPKLIQRFMGEYDVFTRRFIEYKMNPRLNSLFRSENFDALNTLLMWEPQNEISLTNLMEKIEEIYTHNRTQLQIASDIIEYEVLDNFVIGNLSSVSGDIGIQEGTLHNYTGVVANSLASKHKRTAIVYADSGLEIKGSLRDLYNRNYLELFKQFCNANGHNSAFGIHIKYFEFEDFLSYIKMVDKSYSIKQVSNLPIIVDQNTPNPEKDLIVDIATYNEFSGGTTPQALVSRVWLENRKPYSSKYYSRYPWGPFKVKTDKKIRLGSKVLIKPCKGWVSKENEGVELIVTELR